MGCFGQFAVSALPIRARTPCVGSMFGNCHMAYQGAHHELRRLIALCRHAHNCLVQARVTALYRQYAYIHFFATQTLMDKCAIHCLNKAPIKSEHLRLCIPQHNTEQHQGIVRRCFVSGCASFHRAACQLPNAVLSKDLELGSAEILESSSDASSPGHGAAII